MKAVTIGGAVISKAGTMTGGISSDESSKAGRWDEKEVEKLKEGREKLEAERARLDTPDDDGSLGLKGRRSSRDGIRSRIEELRSTVGTLGNKLQYAQTELDYTKKKVKEQQALVGTLEKQIDTKKVQLVEAETEVSNASEAVTLAGQNVKEAEDELFAPFREKTGLNDFRAYDQAMGNARAEFQKKRRTILQHLEKLKAQKEYEDRRDFQTLIANKEKALAGRRLQLEAAKKKEEDILSDLRETKAKLAKAEAQLDTANDFEKDEEKKLKICQKEYKAIQSESANLNKQINTIESDLERLRAKLHETLVKARVEEAEVPLLKSSSRSVGKKRRRSSVAEEDESDDEDPSTNDTSSESSQPITQESSKTIHFSQAEDSRVKKDRKNAGKIDFSNMNEELKERLSDYDQKRVHKDFEDQLSKISTELQSIAPNMKVRT
jgi:structural maintenance of chromosome 1